MKKSILHIFIFSFLLSSCGVAEPIFISNDNLKFTCINDSIFEFSIDANVYNPTKIKYELKDLFFDINYGKEKIGSGKLINPQLIKPKDTVALSFDCNLDLNKLQKKHKQILSKDTVDLYFIGEAFAVHPLKKIRKGFKKKIAYNTKSFISDNMLSNDLTFSQIEIQKINPFAISNLSKSNFRLKIKLYNKQAFDYKIKKIEISLKSKNTNRVVLEGVLDTIIDAPSLQTVEIPLDVASNNLNLLQNLGSFFLGENSDEYIGTGFIVISLEGHDFQIPFLQEFDMKMNPFGSMEANPSSISNTYCSIYIPRTYTRL